MSIEISTAISTADREAVYQLRYQIYIEEIGYRFPYADHDRRILPDQPERGSRILMAVDEGAVVGTAKVDWGGEVPFTDEERRIYQLDHFLPIVGAAGIAIFSRYMAAPSHRSGEVPTRLFDESVGFIRDTGVDLFFLDCRPHLISTYERLGFRTYAPTYSDPVAGLLVPMVMVVDDREHLRRVESRLLPIIERRAVNSARREMVLDCLPHFSPVHTLVNPDLPEEKGELTAVFESSQPRQISIFFGLSTAEIKTLIDHSHVIDCTLGDRIIAEHVTDQTVFLVLGGLVEVRRETRTIAILGPGAVFGEIAFLLNGRRTADVFAASPDTKILALRQKALAQLMDAESKVAARLLLNLSRILCLKLAGPL